MTESLMSVTFFKQMPQGGTPWNFWWGCAARISKSRPNFRPKMPFPTPVFRPGFKNPYPFSDPTLYVIKHNRSNLAGMIYFIYFGFSLTSYQLGKYYTAHTCLSVQLYIT